MNREGPGTLDHDGASVSLGHDLSSFPDEWVGWEATVESMTPSFTLFEGFDGTREGQDGTFRKNPTVECSP